MNDKTPLGADGSLDIAALLDLHRATFGSTRMEGDGDGDAAAQAAAKAAADAAAAKAAADAYKAPASQDELDAIIDRRLNRERAKYANFDEIKAKAEKHDALEAELGSAADKAAKTARDEERAKANGEWTPRVVKAEFKAAAKGVLTDEQLTALLEDLDLSKYVTETGDVDEEKVEKKVAAFAPAGDGKGGKPPARTLGQGNHEQAKPQPGDRGRAAAEKRFGNRAKSAVASGS